MWSLRHLDGVSAFQSCLHLYVAVGKIFVVFKGPSIDFAKPAILASAHDNLWSRQSVAVFGHMFPLSSAEQRVERQSTSVWQFMICLV